MAETDSDLIKKLFEMMVEQKQTIENISNRLDRLEYRVNLNLNTNRSFSRLDPSSSLSPPQLSQNNRFEPSSLQLAIIQELEKANKWISIYDLSTRLKKSRHYINAKINELVQRGLIRRVANVEQQKSTDGEPTPRYLYQIDESGENLLQNLFS